MNPILPTVCSLGLIGASTDSFVSQFQNALSEFRPAIRAVAADEIAVGSIESVATDSKSFVLRNSVSDDTTTIKLNDQTTYTLDGQDVTREAALIVGRRATVTHIDHLASMVAVTTRD